MTDTNFTKEGWGVTSGCYPSFININIGECMDIPVCLFATDLTSEQGDERRSNAHLIAAAPEMYAMLDDLANGRGTDYPIEKLLAKARGEK